MKSVFLRIARSLATVVIWMAMSAGALATERAVDIVPKAVSDFLSNEILSPEEMLQKKEFGKLDESLERTIQLALSGNCEAAYRLYEYYSFQMSDTAAAMVWLTKSADEGFPSARFCLARYYWRKANITKGNGRLIYLKTALFWVTGAEIIDKHLRERIEAAIEDERRTQSSSH